jgi:sulfonate transport system permease protein
MQKLKIYANSLLAPVILIVVWQSLSNAGFLLDVILPSPLKVVKAFWGIINDGTLFIDLKTSWFRVLTGYFFGVVIGLFLGILCGFSKVIERFFSPILDTLRQIPLYAWIPLIILWFGIGETSKYVIIAKTVFVPVFINTLQGVRGVSNDYVEVANVLELSRAKLIRTVILPSALPSIFTGLRLGSGAAWMAVVASEMLGGLKGLGYALMQARDFLRSDKLIALMAVIGLVGFLCDKIIRRLEAVSLRWRKGFEGK